MVCVRDYQVEEIRSRSPLHYSSSLRYAGLSPSPHAVEGLRALSGRVAKQENAATGYGAAKRRSFVFGRLGVGKSPLGADKRCSTKSGDTVLLGRPLRRS